MGCAASRPELDDEYSPQQQQQQQQHDWHHPSLSKGISMPASLHTHNTSLHDFNIVPLSSSTYGINMKIAEQDGQKLFSYGVDAKQDESMKEMLQVLESLDMGSAATGADASALPKSIFDDLKPGLEKHFNQALGNPSKAEPMISRPIPGKENAKPPPLAPSVGANSPTRQKGSASPGPKPSKSKTSFASRFLKRSSSSVGPQKSEGVTDDQDVSVQAGARKSEAGGSLFDADFLASYESALKELSQDDWNALKHDAEQRQQFVNSAKGEGGEVPEIPMPVKKKREDPLEKYEKLCPPGGENSVVLYTTSLRGIRKTFEDCNNLRSVLESFQVSVDERDVAMHQGFRNELREMMGNKPVPVPRLFIKGRYIGGAEDVLQLHEEEELAPLLQDVPRDQRSSAQPCDGCGGARFVPCMDCSGSRKVVDPDNPKEVMRCPDCNENGLIQCPICS